MRAVFSIETLGIGADAARGYQIRRVVAVVEARIGHGQSLLEHVTAAGEVGKERRGLRPPRGPDVDMLAGMIAVSWQTGGRRAVGEVVDGHAVHPVAECRVGQPL